MKNLSTLSVSLVSALAISGCAEFNERYQPILGGIQNTAYQSNLLDCQRIAATQVLLDPQAQSEALVNAGIGAMLGSAEGGGTAAAIEGAKSGVAAGGATTAQKGATDACMQQRGY